jgi:tetratricopeptide (TPR) repeat protein
LEQRLFADAADGRWDEHTLLSASLVASGLADREAVRQYENQVARLADELAASGRMTGSPDERAAALFEFMHQRVLVGGYRIDATVLTRTLDQGRFNCVSASVLFNCLAARFDLPARGLEIPGHAMSRLILPGGPLDVETTCPGWFRLIDHPARQAALVEKTLGRRAATDNRSDKPREVSDVELVATIYYNRGVDLLAEKRFAEALAANAKSLRLDPSNATARGNLLATINNWAVDWDLAGRHAEAIELLRRGLALDRDYETFTVNYVHAHSQWIESLAGAGRFRDALEVIARAGRDQLDEAYFRHARLDVYRGWARTYLEAGEPGRAFSVFDEAAGVADRPADVLDAEVAEVSRRASALVRGGRYSEALALLDAALSRQPDAPLLETERRAAVIGWALPAFQSGNFAEAIRRTTHEATPGHMHQELVSQVRHGYQQWITGLIASGRRLEARRVLRRAMADPFLAGQSDGTAPFSLGN